MNNATKRIIWELRKDGKLWKFNLFYSSLADFNKLHKKTHVLR